MKVVKPYIEIKQNNKGRKRIFQKSKNPCNINFTISNKV